MIAMYLQSVLMIIILFAVFNVIQGAGFNADALRFTKGEWLTIFIAPLVQILIEIIFAGFFGSILSLIAFIGIYVYFTRRYY